MTSSAAAAQKVAETVDVCLIVEGCYPYVPGGVSSWLDWLMRSQPEARFAIVSLWPRPMEMKSRYPAPPNLVRFEHLYLQQFGAKPKNRGRVPPNIDQLGDRLTRLMTEGGAAPLADLIDDLRRMRVHLSLEELFNSPAAWQLVQDMYRREMPNGSFLHYFWAWRALLSGLFAVLEHPATKSARLSHHLDRVRRPAGRARPS